MTTYTAASLQSLKLNELKALVYSLANKVMGTRITQTAHLKKYISSYDFRRRACWEAVALQLQARANRKAEVVAKFSTGDRAIDKALAGLSLPHLNIVPATRAAS